MHAEPLLQLVWARKGAGLRLASNIPQHLRILLVKVQGPSESPAHLARKQRTQMTRSGGGATTATYTS